MSKQDTAARITGAFAHELCNPLQGVQSLINVVGRETARDSALNRKLERIEAGMARVAGVVQAFRTTYENLPRALDKVYAIDLITLFQREFEERGVALKLNSTVDSGVFVFAHAPELAGLAAHALLASGTGSRSVEMTASEEAGEFRLDCELAGHSNDASAVTVFEQGDDLAGVPVLIDELVREARGSAVFRYDDFSLISIRLCLPTSV